VWAPVAIALGIYEASGHAEWEENRRWITRSTLDHQIDAA
jgi:hypothetical protein